MTRPVAGLHGSFGGDLTLMFRVGGAAWGRPRLRQPFPGIGRQRPSRRKEAVAGDRAFILY